MVTKPLSRGLAYNASLVLGRRFDAHGHPGSYNHGSVWRGSNRCLRDMSIVHRQLEREQPWEKTTAVSGQPFGCHHR